MIGFYNYTIIPTCIGLASSILGMMFAMNGNVLGALICLLVSGFFDMIDGAIASTKKRTDKEKRFGIQLDSLADIVCFGALPVVIGYAICGKSIVSYIVFALFTICAQIRLAYFNVDEEDRQTETSEKRKFYEGLPVTTVAALIPMVFCFRPLVKSYFPIIYLVALSLIAIAFVVRFKLKKPGNLGKVLLGFIGLLTLIILLMFY